MNTLLRSLFCMLVASVIATAQTPPRKPSAARLLFCCDESNDLYRAVLRAGVPTARFERTALALEDARAGDAVLVLERGYPGVRTPIDADVYAAAAQKRVRLFVEFPETVPNQTVGAVGGTPVERAVVATDWFGEALGRDRIVSINGLRYLALESDRPYLVAARVAGFDHAIFGLPERTAPLLFEVSEDVLVAATSLSRFVSGRYAPQDAWRAIWHRILSWLRPDAVVPELTWTPLVRASYGPNEALPEGFERQALERGLQWYRNAKMFVHPSFEAEIADGEPARSLSDGAPVGDGTLGSMEAVLSVLHEDGTQTVGTVRRGDCICETAMAMAFGGRVFDSGDSSAIAANLLDYYLFTSDARKRERGDPDNGNFGLIAWGVSTNAWWKASYGDDNARQILGTIAVAALQDEGRWDEAMMQCLLGNLRTTGQLGFRGDRIDVEQLNARGWRSYFRGRLVSYAPHFEAYLWACYLWAFEQTGDRLFFDRAKTALSMTMAQHTDGWRWTNGLAQERARIVLPLAWLVRVEDTVEHRAMLDTAVQGLLSLQEPHGAIREELGVPGRGVFPPPQSNAAYGTNEASLIARDGDPVSDLLYTTNFAFLGLHEAAYATGDPTIRAAADRLAEFLCRVQVRSEGVPMVDGGWFRAFDFGRWEHWGSNADHGWGAWAIESGWTQGWITSVLALRQLDTSLWDLTRESRIERHHERLRASMLPPVVEPALLSHRAVGASVTYAQPPDENYADAGGELVNGRLATEDYLDAEWVGWLGTDATMTVDLARSTAIGSVELNCLRALRVGIHLPRTVTVSVSQDGVEFREVAEVLRPAPEARGEDGTHRFSATLGTTARYVRVAAQGEKAIPTGFPAAGSRAWLFVDELVVDERD